VTNPTDPSEPSEPTEEADRSPPAAVPGTGVPAGGGGRLDAPGEPDARFTFANERTFLAWSRTALALVVAGLAITQLLPPFGFRGGRRVIGLPLIGLGAALAFTSYRQWAQNQRALRLRRPIPRSPLPRILALVVSIVALVALIIVLVSREPGL
jgi:putative membrane protein